MELTDVLDVFERLFNAAQHPDIAEVRRYGKGTAESLAGVDLRDQRDAHMYLSGPTTWKGKETPLEVPEQLPPPRLGAQRIAVLAAQLLDAAKPAQFRAWRLVALENLGPTDQRGTVPAGVSVLCADGSRILLRATSGASQTPYPAEDPFPQWRVPTPITV
ncbi:hypothetical protein [Actinoplanes sp. GCM10030250]|uniref:hypothetical protein n=1 Tax=Actinoplanes sp. GCM10030250 TaxID=3273376 RepID=UPI003610F422